MIARGKRLSGLTLPDCPGEISSIVPALGAMLRCYGGRVDVAELACVTGTAFLLSYSAKAERWGYWNVCGAQAFLESAARLYGLELRDLHPAEAAPLPFSPPEFEAHWRDSYRPFVDSSLSRDEPVLVWMGWPAPYESQWGVLAGRDAATGRYVGRTAGCGQELTLKFAPAQVYSVVGNERRRPSPAELAEATLAAAAAVLGNRLPTGMEALSGPGALERLRDLKEGTGFAGVRLDAIRFGCCRAMSVGRQAAVDFLSGHDEPMEPRIGRAVESLRRILRRQIELIGSLDDPGDLSARANASFFERLIGLESEAAEATRSAAGGG